MKPYKVSKYRSALMSSIPSKNTRPEVAVRRILHAMGQRFRLHQKTLPGTPDIVLKRHRTVVFVHGCFWHQHTRCSIARLPMSRRDYWWPKLKLNSDRDKRARKALRLAGWRVVVVWECETKNTLKLSARLAEFFTE